MKYEQAQRTATLSRLGSPRRHELLTRLGYRFEVPQAGCAELRNDGEKPQDYVCRLARDKAMAGVARRPRRCLCWGRHHSGAGERVLEKPSDLLDAKDMLEALSGGCTR